MDTQVFSFNAAPAPAAKGGYGYPRPKSGSASTIKQGRRSPNMTVKIEPKTQESGKKR